MKKNFSPATSFAVAIFLVAQLADPLPIGAPLPDPDKKMKDISDNELSFKEVMKKDGLLVMFSCNTCPIVWAYQARTNEVCQYARDKQIGVVLLNSNEGNRDGGDSFDDMKQYADQHGYKWPYLLDDHSAMAAAFGASRTPECFLFNAAGKLVYHGAIDNNASSPDAVTRKHLMIAIDEMLSGKEVSVKTTRSVGCTIRRG